MTTNHYKTLEVEQEATSEEIRLAYKKLALVHHPDKNLDSYDEANKKFKEISKAYEVLSDPSKRREYDQPDVFDDNEDMGFEDLFRSEFEQNLARAFQRAWLGFFVFQTRSSRASKHAVPTPPACRSFLNSYSEDKKTSEISYDRGEHIHIAEVLENNELKIRTTINTKVGKQSVELFKDELIVIRTTFNFKNGKSTTETYENGVLKAKF